MVTTLPSEEEQLAQWNELQELVMQKGLLNRQYRYYAGKILITLCMLGVSMWCVATFDQLWVLMANAVFLAFVFGQIGLLDHASGHRQILTSPRGNKWISMVGGFLIGLSLVWWAEKHNSDHHGNPNNLKFDQDVNVSVLAFTKGQAMEKRGVYRFMVKYQHFLFFPVLLLEAFSIRLDSIQYLLRSSRRKQDVKWFVLGLEFVSMCAHVAGYVVLLWFLDSWVHRIAFLVVHQGLLGVYLGSLFATNHKGMEMLYGETGRGHLWKQVPTTRNVVNPRWLDWLLDLWFGGLNSQIEHHLFNSMPENRLREARKIVKSFCKEHGIPYCETGFFQTYWRILGFLREVSKPLRDHPDPSIYST